MQALKSALHQWFAQVYSFQLLIIIVILVALVRYLVTNAQSMPERRFFGLSILGGLVGLLALGVATRTPSVAGPLGLPTAAINEQWLSWVKAVIALAAAGLSVYEAVLLQQKKPLRA